MRKGTGLWAVYLVLGALLWLASVGFSNHSVYMLCLMVVLFSWFGYTVSAKSN